MQSFGIVMALTMGFAGSLHCVGMCGPIVWLMPFRMMSGLRKWLALFSYHLGRISIYALMGVSLFGFRNAFDPQVQQYISILAGSMLLAAGLLSFMPKARLRLPWGGWVQRHLGKFMTDPSPGSLLVAGMLNGLLPCGLVYMALAGAVAAPSPWQAAALMYAFGLGTMPALVTMTLAGQKLGFARLARTRRVLPLIMFGMGALFLLRGMNLGIPYLSPHIDPVQHTVAPCCHQ